MSWLYSGDSELHNGGVQVHMSVKGQIGKISKDISPQVDKNIVSHRFASTPERQKRLSEGWAFTCDCSICTSGETKCKGLNHILGS